MNEIVNKNDFVGTYINMNGIIEKEKLQSLLKEYNNLDLSIEELDTIVKEIDATILEEKYYSWITDLDKEDIKNLKEMKDKFNKYKAIDFELDSYEEEFKDKLQSLLEQELILTNKIDDIYYSIIELIKYGIFKEEMVNLTFKDLHISIKDSLKKKIFNLYKEYKKYISVWSYNGYTITEYNEMNQIRAKKIGRNEPCPCGSGKKYKQCCGKLKSLS